MANIEMEYNESYEIWLDEQESLEEFYKDLDIYLDDANINTSEEYLIATHGF